MAMTRSPAFRASTQTSQSGNLLPSENSHAPRFSLPDACSALASERTDPSTFTLVRIVAGALVAMWDPIERLLVGARAMDEAARARALRAFHENGLHRTEHGTGVLVFASLFEHAAVVLGDHGIHARMGDAEWDRAVAALVAGMRAGAPPRGFVDAIAVCGAKLAEHFPRDPGAKTPPNELEDAIRASRT